MSLPRSSLAPGLSRTQQMPWIQQGGGGTTSSLCHQLSCRSGDAWSNGTKKRSTPCTQHGYGEEFRVEYSTNAYPCIGKRSTSHALRCRNLQRSFDVWSEPFRGIVSASLGVQPATPLRLDGSGPCSDLLPCLLLPHPWPRSGSPERLGGEDVPSGLTFPLDGGRLEDHLRYGGSSSSTLHDFLFSAAAAAC